MTLPHWMQIGIWRKNLFSMLFVLSARVPDFSITSFWNNATSEMALVVRKEDEIFVEISEGDSKNKAKQSVAEKIIHSANIWEWVNTKYADMPCDRYLE